MSVTEINFIRGYKDMIKHFDYEKIKLTPGLFKERMTADVKYLLSLDSRALLQNYMMEAGIILPENFTTEDPTKTYYHWGWEAPTCQLRGHFLGHWMSAAARAAVSEGDRSLKAKLFDIIDQLKEMQKLNGGKWVAPIPEKYMKIMETDRYIWSPQYTMHKLFLGLLDSYKYTGYEPALEILSGLADWYVDWVSTVGKDKPWVMYRGESGGMLEIWADLYGITKDKKYLKLVKAYDTPELVKMLEKGQDPLTANHTNSSIPWAHGLAKLYEVTGDKKWLDLTKAFWKCAVTDREYYATGGQNAGEFWIPQGRLGEYISDRNQEFCTVYNMVRLADYLYRFTGEELYLDYIERNLYNGFLAHQNATTGMPTYFMSMKPESHKKWGTERNDFWCCHGTMIQSQTVYQDLTFYQADDGVTVAQYIPVSGKCSVNGADVNLEMNSVMDSSSADALFEESADSEMSRWNFELKVSCDKETEFTLSLRIPTWIDKAPVITVDGKKVRSGKNDYKNGFLKIKRAWKDSVIGIRFVPALREEGLTDRPDLKAILDGPILLAAVGAPVKLMGKSYKSLIKKTERVYQVYPWLQNHYNVACDGADRELMPLYEIQDQAYSIYQKA